MRKDAEFFYCPYCSEENLFPAGEEAWHCACCLRTFVVILTSYGLTPERHTEAASRG
jgi:hypothetical protein